MKKIKASTILEVVVAMTVVLVVMVIAIMIVTNVTRSTLSARQLRARLILAEELQLAKANSCQDKVLDNAWRIECKSEPYGSAPATAIIHLRLYDDQGAFLTEARKVVIIEKDDEKP